MKKFSLVQTLALLAVATTLAACGGGNNSTATAEKTATTNAAASTGGAAAGTPFTSDAGGFTVTLPVGFGPLREKKNEATKMTGYTSSGPNNVACNVSYSEFSTELASQLDTPEKLDKALGAMRDNSIAGMNGIPDKEEKISVQGHPGLSVHGTIPGDQTVYFRMDNVIARARGYRFGCMSTSKDELDKPEIQSFFNSFKLK